MFSNSLKMIQIDWNMSVFWQIVCKRFYFNIDAFVCFYCMDCLLMHSMNSIKIHVLYLNNYGTIHSKDWINDWVLCHVNLLSDFLYTVTEIVLTLSDMWNKQTYTGCFIMFSVITNIYNKKTKGPTLMEFFTATGKLKGVFFFYN